MYRVNAPREMNETFARAFNTRNVNNLLDLFEANARLRPGESETTRTGIEDIGAELQGLLQTPGRMVSRNNFCIEHDDIALLRADWALVDPGDNVLVSGSSAEIIRRQPDGSWRYVIDHAAGASLPRCLKAE